MGTLLPPRCTCHIVRQNRVLNVKLYRSEQMDQDCIWYGGRPRLRPHCVRWGPCYLHPLKSGGHISQFSAHVRCGQTTGWIKMPLCRDVDVSPGDIVLDGDPAPPKRGRSSPLLSGPYLLWPNGRPSQLLLSTCFLFLPTRLLSSAFSR